MNKYKIMRSIILILVCFIHLKSNGQSDFKTQYKLIKSNIISPFETIREFDFVDYENRFQKDTFFIDYILRKYSKESRIVKFISNRYNLEKFVDIYLKQNAIRLSLIKKDTIEINIAKEYRSIGDIRLIKYDSTYLKNATQPSYEFKYIKTVEGRNVYGFIFDTNTVTKIKFISININGMETQIDEAVFEDLYFPNFCEIDYTIKPIEAFLSPDGNYIYFYLFGGQENFEYFCKIIFDIKKKSTVGRMIADYKELGVYQCLYPKKFIGF